VGGPYNIYFPMRPPQIVSIWEGTIKKWEGLKKIFRASRDWAPHFSKACSTPAHVLFVPETGDGFYASEARKKICIRPVPSLSSAWGRTNF